MQEIILSRELITAERARALLSQNNVNRKMQEGWVKKLAYIMKSGGWDEKNGATIQISEHGTLIDGQHRLQALIIANKRYHFNIAYNVPIEAFSITDIGKGRTIANALEANGVKSASDKGTIIIGIDRLVKSYRIRTEIRPSNKTSNDKKNYTPRSILSIYEANKIVVEDANSVKGRAANYIGKINFMTKSAVGIFYGYTSLFYPSNIVENYIIAIAKGENIDSNSVEYKIRQKLIETKSDPFQKMSSAQMVSMLIHGFNLILDRKSWSRNKYDGSMVELKGCRDIIPNWKIIEL